MPVVYLHDVRYEGIDFNSSVIKLYFFVGHDQGHTVLTVIDPPHYFFVDNTPENLSIAKTMTYVKEQRRMSFMYHPEPSEVLRITCQSQFQCRSWCKRFDHTYESHVDPVLRFIQTSGITAGKWYSIPETFMHMPATFDQIDQIQPIDVIAQPEYMSAPRQMVVASFDIETSGLVAISSIVHIIGIVLNTGRKICIHMHGVKKDEGDGEEEGKDEEKDGGPEGSVGNAPEVEFISCSSERELLLEFSRQMIDNKVSVIMGYNITAFDWSFLIERATALGIVSMFRHMSWWEDSEGRLVEVTLREYSGRTTMDIVGVHSIDVYLLAKPQMKLDSYSLNSVAAEVIGSEPENQKHSIPIHEMLRCGDPAMDPGIRMRVCMYCIQDCDLVARIAEIRDYVNIAFESASLGFVLPHHSMYRGITFKIGSLFMHHTTRRGMVYNGDNDDNEGKYRGGFVVTPIKGAHRAVGIADFASLYPSQIVAHTLCFSLQLTPGQAQELDPDRVRRVVIDEDDPESEVAFFYIPDGIDETIVPFIEKGLYSARTKWKREMKRHPPGSPGHKCANANQLSVKVLMNAIYGAMALLCRTVAECVTGLGRQTIKKTIQIAQERFGARLIYGDTDSMMIQMSGIESIATVADREQAFDKLKEICDYVTEYWYENTRPKDRIVVLEPENIADMFCQNHKMYASYMYGSPRAEAKWVVKGLAPGRRSTPTFVRQAVSQFLQFVVKQQFMDAYKVIQGVVEYLQRHCSRGRLDAETLRNFTITSSYNQEEYDVPTPASVVVHRRISRSYDERYTIGSQPGIGDRIAYVAVDPAVRERLRYHVLRVHGWPVGKEIKIDGVPYTVPCPVNGTQSIVFEKLLRFVPDPRSNEHRILTIHVECGMCLGRVFMDELKVYRVVGEMVTFRVTDHSVSLYAEDAEFVGDTQLDYRFYVERLVSPVKTAARALLDSVEHGGIPVSTQRLFSKMVEYCNSAESKRKGVQSQIDVFFKKRKV